MGKLDSEGRTIFDTTEDNGKVKQQSEDATIPKINIDYNSKTVPTAIADMGDDFMDDILFDAEIADCALLPRESFFILSCICIAPAVEPSSQSYACPRI